MRNGWLSVSKDILVQVVSVPTAAGVWQAIEGLCASQSRARVINTRMALATTQKGNMSVADYVTKMRALADEMASAGKKLDDEDLVSYILAGLDAEFNPLVSAVAARVEPISMGDLISQMTSFEQHQELLHGAPQSSVNTATRGRGGNGQRGRGRGCGGDRGHGEGRQGDNGPPSGRPIIECQLCGKMGHTIIKCYKRFDTSFTGEKKSSAAATTSYGIDTNWYTDSGATDHITSDLEKLTVRDRYTGGDQLHTASGSGMEINQIGHTIVHTLHKNLSLNNVLYVPDSSKNLVSVHRLTSDNNVFLEFHPNHFFVKDLATRKTLLQGRCERGLYPLPAASNKSAYGIDKLSSTRWHSRLGHPSEVVIRQALGRSNVPFVNEFNKDTICDACQKGKSHQLPYPKSVSRSSAPLELVFSGVWGPAPTSVGRNNY